MVGTLTLTALMDLVTAVAGLSLGVRDQASFSQTVQHRVAALRLAGVEDYYRLLKGGDAQNSPLLASQGQQEWRLLLSQLTIGESYFFRDQRQLSLLRQTLIPELLARPRAVAGQRPLRLWSAGCATGEEAYSLGIMLRQLGVHQQGWQPEVLGTDVNPDFLLKAQCGVYGAWSFRQTAPQLREQHFVEERGSLWRVRPDVQQMIRFAEFNLVSDPVMRLTGAGKFDLIVCRNVFIYFTPGAIATTLAKFYEALTPGGYLITGHAELQGIPLNGFQVRSFPESIVYQRPLLAAVTEPVSIRERARLGGAAVAAVQSPALPVPVGSPAQARQASPATVPVSSLSAGVPIPTPANLPPTTCQAMLDDARQLANTGHYPEARQACEAAIAAHPFAVEPCYLLASIAEETGDIEGAKIFLKRVIYLDPKAIPAYLELADLYDCGQDADRAEKTRRSALAVLEQMPAAQTLPACAGLSVKDLSERLRQRA